MDEYARNTGNPSTSLNDVEVEESSKNYVVNN
ncbi:MAG: hypothetical protein sL5_11030 [Candidatus Mesenet longicola]|uniref:Uncharacterized protein n=1 Tax=Candidatus Mesenet longicola TaxID=1892558 RepID=A0A8J3MPP4_9RICK|nr:MAG: hypothetical protein sGL2_11520 [Candidatus Mesenet longicola]GHM60110.1 MAG: hypothetical protein sL5_11030 [Candidatus Mesenet longicola]